MHKFPVLFSLWLAAAAMLSADDAILLRAHWEPGKVYTQETTTEMTVMVPELENAGGGQKTEFTQTMSITVKPEPGTGNRLANIKFLTMKAKMSVMGQNMTYDSTDPAKSAPMLQQAFGAIVGKEFTLIYDKNDTVTGTKDLDKLIPTPVGGGKGMNGAQMADAFRKSQEMGLPKDPVASGATWNFENKIEMPPTGAIVIKGSGKFDSIIEIEGHKNAKVLINGKFTSPEADAPAAADSAMAVKFGAGSTMEGEIDFDIDRRVISRSEINSLLKMNVGGKEIPMTQKMISKLISVMDAK